MFAQRNKLLFLLIGSGMGAGLALLFAPAPGSQFRSGLAELARSKFDRGRMQQADLNASSEADRRSLPGHEQKPGTSSQAELEGEDLLELV